MVTKEASAFVKWYFKRIKEPDILLLAAHFFWEETHNPIYAWWAIEICTRGLRVEFPDWVRQYLADCASRMLSPAAAEESDVRKVLPGIMGFTLKKGRGNPLDLSTKEAERFDVAALRFAIEIEKGEKPRRALSAAFDFIDPEFADKMDEKTLLSHIKKFFGVAKAPRTNSDWKRAIRTWQERAIGPFVEEYREISS